MNEIGTKILTLIAPLIARWQALTAPGSRYQQTVWMINRFLEQRDPRERAMLAGAVLLVTGTIWYQGFFASGARALKMANHNFDVQNTTNEGLRARVAELELLQQMAEDPDRPVLEQIAEAQTELELLNDRLVEEGLSFIAPAPMSEVITALEGVLEEERSAQLISFERRNGGQLFQSGNGSDASWSIGRNEIHIIFEADYRGAIAYLQAVERLPFKFAWEELKYQVQSYPLARVEVRLSAFAPEELP